MSDTPQPGALALNLSRRISLLAMINHAPPPMVEAWCCMSIAELARAATGAPLSYWDFDTVTQALEAWDAGEL